MKYVITCICHGDSCDGHATKIGSANSMKAAQEIIDEDKQLFKDNTLENMVDAKPDEFVEKPNEIWWLDDGMNGRVYDIIEV